MIYLYIVSFRVVGMVCHFRSINIGSLIHPKNMNAFLMAEELERKYAVKRNLFLEVNFKGK